MSDNNFPGWHGTTIVSVRKGNKVVVAGDGQVSMGQTVMKHTAKKLHQATELDAEDIARRAMKIAEEICVYTNGNVTVETIELDA